MLCCGGNAMWTMGKIVDHAVVDVGNGMAINLHFSFDTPLAIVTNWEPFDGRFQVVPKRDGMIRVRRPAYARQIEATIGGEQLRPKSVGDYIVFEAVRSGEVIEMTYELPERTTEETTLETLRTEDKGHGVYGPKSDPVIKERIQTTWRGNTVLAIDYEEASEHPPKHRLYLDRMERYRARADGDVTARYFLPDRPFSW